ncbi:MAG TPA: CRISPR-associated endonuclease Cas2 [Kiritimatiellia bacterium]|nr:CRISPR-associated endonuclease Cas2 [Kiritimatiellia bacterium]HRU71128.1 CRISPR-associated endonuclease Cas2 [Kiritimatiellia bacterium]
MRRFYLVSYDISDDRRRARVFKLMRGWGERVQYSVFCCQLNPRERLQLIEELKERMNNNEDQTLFVDAGAMEGERPVPEITYVGKVWRPEQRSQVV